MAISQPSICDACTAVAVSPGVNAPHPYMLAQGTRPQQSEKDGTVKQYRCVQCQTIWLLHHDQWGGFVSAKIMPIEKLAKGRDRG